MELKRHPWTVLLTLGAPQRERYVGARGGLALLVGRKLYACRPLRTDEVRTLCWGDANLRELLADVFDAPGPDLNSMGPEAAPLVSSMIVAMVEHWNQLDPQNCLIFNRAMEAKYV